MNDFFNRDGGDCIMVFSFNGLGSDGLFHDWFGSDSLNWRLSEFDVDSFGDHLGVNVFLSDQQVSLNINFLVSDSVSHDCRFGDRSVVDNSVRRSLNLNVNKFSLLNGLDDFPGEVLITWG